MNLYIDYGGTKFRYSYDEEFNTIHEELSSNINLQEFLDREIENKKEISFIGISVAGQVSKGTIVSAPNINIENLNIKEYIESSYDIELEVENDLKCAALAEFQYSSSFNMALFYIGTGFGGCVIDNQNMIKGQNNIAGEIGHIPFKHSPFKCGCGRNDCLELYTSGSAIEKWCNFFEIEESYNSIEKLKELNTEKSDMIIENFYEGLKHAFHTAITLFDFDDLVIGGGIGKSDESIITLLKEELVNCSFKDIRKNISIRLSSLENGSLAGTKLLKNKRSINGLTAV